MATIPDNICLAVMTLHGGPPPILYVPEAALETFVKGEYVYINGAGYAAEITGDTPPVIYGVAAEPAHNSTPAGTNNVAIFLARPDVLFELNMKQSGLADHVSVAGDFGHPMAIQRDTTNSKIFLNASTQAGANVRMFVHTIGRGSVVGDTNARVWASFLPNNVQFLATS
jgi:hypothetical protein